MVFPDGFTEVDDDSELKSAYDMLSSGNYKLSLQMFSDLSDSGIDEATYAVAFHHLNGFGAPKDVRRGVKMLEVLAEKGFVPAVSDLAQCYAYGVGVKTDDRRAFELFSQSAEAGDPYAMGMLSLMYHEGSGVRRDHKMAETWSDRMDAAADIEDVEERGLGYIESGNGLLARMFLMRSAMMGSPVSAKALHIMFSFGVGVGADDDEAEDWESTADDLGWSEVTPEDLDDHAEWFSRYVDVPDSED